MKKSKDWVVIIGLLAIVIMAASGYWFGIRETHSTALVNESKTLHRIDTRKTEATFTLLTVEEAKVMHQSGQAIFLDARSDREFQYSHIPRAISAYYVSAKSNPQVLALDRNTNVIAYCNSTKCPMAEVLATRLDELGFTRIYVFSGGMKDWLAAKLPVQEASVFQ